MGYEKKIKAWKRWWKIELLEFQNPNGKPYRVIANKTLTFVRMTRGEQGDGDLDTA
jgi:hypothetical protein